MHKMDIAASDRLANIQEYYFSSKLEEIREMNANGEDVINLGIGSPDMPPSEAVKGTSRRSSKEGRGLVHKLRIQGYLCSHAGEPRSCERAERSSIPASFTITMWGRFTFPRDLCRQLFRNRERQREVMGCGRGGSVTQRC